MGFLHGRRSFTELRGTSPSFEAAWAQRAQRAATDAGAVSEKVKSVMPLDGLDTVDGREIPRPTTVWMYKTL